jgi:hypothetical protein
VRSWSPQTVASGGGGSSCSQDWDFWVYPLPPGGPVTLVASGAERGIAEWRAELDGAAIRAAAGRAVTLWPEEASNGHVAVDVRPQAGRCQRSGDDQLDAAAFE